MFANLGELARDFNMTFSFYRFNLDKQAAQDSSFLKTKKLTHTHSLNTVKKKLVQEYNELRFVRQEIGFSPEDLA